MNTRLCVICKKKLQRDMLYRFVVLNDEIVIDVRHRVDSYGYYFCKEHIDYELSLKKFLKRKRLKRVYVG